MRLILQEMILEFCGITILPEASFHLTEMEDRMNIVIEDDDVDGEMLETYGGLLAFAEAKAIEA